MLVLFFFQQQAGAKLLALVLHYVADIIGLLLLGTVTTHIIYPSVRKKLG